MTYIEQFKAELKKRLDSPEHTASIVEWMAEKVLESYKNGLAAGRKRAGAKRQGKNNGSPAQAQ